jgi:hypothetical protein
MIFVVLYVEETRPSKQNAILLMLVPAVTFKRPPPTSSCVAQAATDGEPSQTAEVFVFPVDIFDENGLNSMGPVHLL